MVSLNRILKATALAIITTAAAIPIPSMTDTASALASTTPLFVPGEASFSHGNMITFINTDSTPRKIVITSNDYDQLTTIHLEGLQTANQSVPDYWSGNAFAVNASLPDVTGILAEFSFTNESQVYFDVSSIVNPCDMDGVKIVKPAIADEPIAGCDSMETPCTNSYLYSVDDYHHSISTPERVLLVYVGNGKQLMPVVTQLSFTPYTTVISGTTWAPTSCRTRPISPTSQPIFSAPPTATFTITPFISSQSIVPTSVSTSSLASVSTIVITVTQTVITTMTITTSSIMRTSFIITSPPPVPPVTETITIISLISIPEYTTTVTVNLTNSAYTPTSTSLNTSSVFNSSELIPTPSNTSTVTFSPCTTTLSSNLSFRMSVHTLTTSTSTSQGSNVSDNGPHIRVAPLNRIRTGQRN